MSMREQEAPEFASAFRGYDRAQVDEYVTWMRNHALQAEDRAARASVAAQSGNDEAGECIDYLVDGIVDGVDVAPRFFSRVGFSLDCVQMDANRPEIFAAQ